MVKLKVGVVGEGCWIDFLEGIGFKIRPINAAILSGLQKEATLGKRSRDLVRMRVGSTKDDKSLPSFLSLMQARLPAAEPNQDRLEDLINDYILEDWRGDICGPDGAPLAVNLENKKIIMDDLTLNDFIWSAAKALNLEVDDGNEDLGQNPDPDVKGITGPPGHVLKP